MSNLPSKKHTDGRREFLKYLSVAMGATAASTVLSGSNLAVAMNYHAISAKGVGAVNLFDAKQKAVLFSVCDAILPKTDTPSATQVDCHGFIEHQLVHCHNLAQQSDCKGILQDISSAAKSKHNASFTQLPVSQQQQILVDIEKQAGFTAEQKRQFGFLKSLLVFGYFTSEAGATQALNYQAVPGGFKGSIPYTADSKAWGSFAYY